MKTYNYIYKITNLINGKVYIGKHSTDNLDDGYMGSGKLIKKSIKKHGQQNFTKEYLAFCDTEDKLNWFEKYYIKKYNSRDLSIGYNLTDGGDGTLGFESPFKGKHHTSAAKQKLRDATINQLATLGHPMTGKQHSPQSKEKMSKIAKNRLKDKENHPLYGKHHTEDTKAKISKSNKGLFAGDKNPFYGKQHLPETKEKMKGPVTEEHKQKLRKPKRKALWQKPDGSTVVKSSTGVQRWHPDWIKINDL